MHLFALQSKAFLQIFSPRNLLFCQVLRKTVFLNSKCLTFLYLFKQYKEILLRNCIDKKVVKFYAEISFRTDALLPSVCSHLFSISELRAFIKFALITEAVVLSCSVKTLVYKILQNSQGHAWVRASFLIKLQACNVQVYQERDFDTGVFM